MIIVNIFKIMINIMASILILARLKEKNPRYALFLLSHISVHLDYAESSHPKEISSITKYIIIHMEIKLFAPNESR